MRKWPDLSAHLPPAVSLRVGLDLSALKGPDQDRDAPDRIEVNILEIAAAIAGEPISRTPRTVCARTIAPFARLLSDMNDKARPHLMPYAWAMAGSASPAHVSTRLEILARMAIDVARLQAPAFEKARPKDRCVENAIATAEAYWVSPSADKAEAANAAQKEATQAAQHVLGASRLANLAAHGAAGVAHAAHSAFLALGADDAFLARMAGQFVQPSLFEQAGVLEGVRDRFAVDAAEQAAITTITPEDVEGTFWRDEAATRALAALRTAIEAGPHGAIPPIRAAERLAAASF